MEPIRHEGSNFVYRGPSSFIGDLWVQRVPVGGANSVRSVWELSDDERQMIAEGGRIELAIYGEPMPPVSLAVLPEGMCRPIEAQKFRVPDEDLEGL